MKKTIAAAMTALLLMSGHATAQVILAEVPVSDSTNVQKTEIGRWVITREYEESNTDDADGVRHNSSVKYDISRGHGFTSHYPIFFLGLSQFNDDALSFESNTNFDLNRAKSWSWGTYAIQDGVAFGPNNHLGVTWALGLNYSFYKMAEPYCFLNDGRTTYYDIYVNADGRAPYSETWFRYWTFNIPVSLQFQGTVKGNDFYVSVGPELEYRLGATSLGRADGHKRKEVITKNLDMNPIGANLVAQLGYGSFTFIAKSALVPIFPDNGTVAQRGGEWQTHNLYPFTLGVGLTF